MTMKRFWHVRGYVSTTLIFERLIPLGAASQKQMAQALRVLTASAGLTRDEILDCHLRRNAKSYRDLLDVHVGQLPEVFRFLRLESALHRHRGAKVNRKGHQEENLRV